MSLRPCPEHFSPRFACFWAWDADREGPRLSNAIGRASGQKARFRRPTPPLPSACGFSFRPAGDAFPASELSPPPFGWPGANLGRTWRSLSHAPLTTRFSNCFWGHFRNAVPRWGEDAEIQKERPQFHAIGFIAKFKILNFKIELHSE